MASRRLEELNEEELSDEEMLYIGSLVNVATGIVSAMFLFIGIAFTIFTYSFFVIELEHWLVILGFSAIMAFAVEYNV